MIFEIAHFRRGEFACRCCGKNNISGGLVLMLEMIRRAMGGPLVVSSGFRCEAHNVRVGGALKSRHLIGAAADILKPENMNYGDFVSLLRRYAGPGYEVKSYPSETYAHYAIPRAAAGGVWNGKGIEIS